MGDSRVPNIADLHLRNWGMNRNLDSLLLLALKLSELTLNLPNSAEVGTWEGESRAYLFGTVSFETKASSYH